MVRSFNAANRLKAIVYALRNEDWSNSMPRTTFGMMFARFTFSRVHSKGHRFSSRHDIDAPSLGDETLWSYLSNGRLHAHLVTKKLCHFEVGCAVLAEPAAP
jgi:hypothetical protein